MIGHVCGGIFNLGCIMIIGPILLIVMALTGPRGGND